MSDRKPTSVVLPVAVAALVLLGLYVGAYYATVIPVIIEPGDASFVFLYDIPESITPDTPEGRYARNWFAILSSPQSTGLTAICCAR